MKKDVTGQQATHAVVVQIEDAVWEDFCVITDKLADLIHEVYEDCDWKI